MLEALGRLLAWPLLMLVQFYRIAISPWLGANCRSASLSAVSVIARGPSSNAFIVTWSSTAAGDILVNRPGPSSASVSLRANDVPSCNTMSRNRASFRPFAEPEAESLCVHCLSGGGGARANSSLGTLP